MQANFHAVISIHALREEGDSCNHDTFPSPWHFYPRPPRGGRRIQYADPTTFQPISIHALREEGDNNVLTTEKRKTIFLSTPSARRATGGAPGARLRAAHFYPRPPRGGRPDISKMKLDELKISIHALREEGDVSSRYICPQTRHFYPRPPRGGRLLKTRTYLDIDDISIHALREEGDGQTISECATSVEFLSTPSARRATGKQGGVTTYVIFLSTPSARRATRGR